MWARLLRLAAALACCVPAAGLAVTRRAAVGRAAAALAPLAPAALPCAARAVGNADAAAGDAIVAFVAADYGFSHPAAFESKPKPLRTHADEVLLKRGSSQIGVVVDPVKISTLADFGTLDFVGEKVVTSERGRDGVTSAELLSTASAEQNGLLYYDLDYANECSRGDTRFLARCVVSKGKLYVFTAQAKVKDWGPDVSEALTKARGSFRVNAS
ncbi:hypothetical protein M885DRAFT_610045 [Pelagophyceae sp. CCMP2097]|nr:hypothetical protein M885DRAFT_610045 [Pelagophyceae sp. CCMP2097]